MKLDDGEIKEDAGAAGGAKTEDPLARGGVARLATIRERNEQKMPYQQSNVGGFRRDGSSRMRRMVSAFNRSFTISSISNCVR